MFYKYENNELTFGNYISGFDNEYNGFDLSALEHYNNTYTYPEHNWYWFDSLEEANTFFGITND